MALKSKYIVLNKKSDFASSILENIEFDTEEKLYTKNVRKKAYILGECIDSTRLSCDWSRMKIQGDFHESSIKKIHIFASDTKNIRKIEDELYDENYNFDEKIAILKTEFNSKELTNDISLLRGIKGRYLYYIIELIVNNKDDYIDSIVFEYNNESFLYYFPSIYSKKIKEDDFFYRFLHIFQDIYIEIEEKIDKKFLDYDMSTLSKEALDRLVKMLKLEEIEKLDDAFKRKLMANYKLLCFNKGSKKGIKALCELYFESQVEIVENYRVFEEALSDSQKEKLKEKFEDDMYSFTILIEENSLLKTKDINAFTEFLEAFIPAKAKFVLIFESKRESELILGTTKSTLPVRI